MFVSTLTRELGREGCVRLAGPWTRGTEQGALLLLLLLLREQGRTWFVVSTSRTRPDWSRARGGKKCRPRKEPLGMPPIL